MTPAAISAAEYTSRRAYLAREVAAGRMARDEAEARLTPWLHLAAICGAEVPGTVEDGLHLYPWDRAGQPAQVPLVLSLSPAERTEALRALANARDAAILACAQVAGGGGGASARSSSPKGGSADRVSRARNLMRLASHLGAPPIDRARTAPPSQKEAVR